ncbi:Polyphosphate kinase [Thermovibrio ammonificans HB-1]|jgi:polyphosphate kinase|uniref:Polyphosphate kinase n=1 Tax=Thermovibrio ammonificans (strain DSM 15698 / JCM 12110 / HB-1) TaxID=648996 RepID=E8T3F0_THEA1|nr:polyphosphate kinase 1 [Thermovibrio ammonificans]ADU97282.1 Polyphosphate kinase [Thermovibrio ammonificans HB-1]
MGSAKVNLNDPKLYINRELSWLEFNRRVLEEAEDPSNPLLERLKFLAIFFTNLDEFFMIRVAGLKKMVEAGVNRPSFDGLTPVEQLRKISKKTRELLKVAERDYRELLKELRGEKLYIYSYGELPARLKRKADKYFKEIVFPVLTPLAVDLTHPFPHLPSLSFNIIVEMRSHELKFGLIPVPKVLPRFVKLDESHYLYLEDLILNHVEELFPNQEITETATFRVTRDADIVIQEDEADDLLEEVEKGLRKRKFGKPVRLEINGGSEFILALLKDELELTDQDIFQMKIPLNLSDLWSLYKGVDRPDLKFPPYVPYYPPQFEVDLFLALRRESALLFHPYESFDPVVELLQEAAEDPKVLAIKQTLYRVGKNSPVVEALSRAAQNGKEVTAVVELKARFDEESNIVWAKKLEEDGVHVVYGVPGLKTHAKLLMIVREEEGRIRRYVHFGTGNYNVETARVYSDVSYLTCDDELGEDVSRLFNVITGYFHPPKLNRLYISPVDLKEKILSLIEEEASLGGKGRIVAKMNSLVDPEVIRALYRASRAGVKIDLIVRGICCLRPGLKGISENIRVVSIVGKYLEHARIFYFGKGDRVFISSADWMPRNFHRRVETLVPVEEPKLKEKLKEILKIQLRDTAKARILQPDGTYVRPEKRDFNSQEYFERWVREYSL